MKKTILAAAASLAVIIPTALHADLNKQMDQMFGTMSNVTAPGASMGARRGVISGGSIYQRTPQMNANLYNVSGPRLDIGPCGDIDMTAGSFSFISKDEFVQLARNIAANAKGYAFTLALASICPTCEDQVANLREALQKMNIAALDSCQFAQDMLGRPNVSPTAMDGIVDKGIKSITTAIGDGPDSFFSFGTRESAAVSASEEAKKRAQEAGVTGNALLQSLKKQRFSSWANFNNINNNDYLSQIMSITGTVIVRLPESTTSTTQEDLANTPPEVQYVEPTITFIDLFEGTLNQDGLNGPGKRVVKVFDCQTDLDVDGNLPQDACVGTQGNGSNLPSIKTREIELIGFRSRVQRILIGQPDNNIPGLVQKIGGQYTLPLTPEEEAFIGLIPEYAAMITRMGKRSPSAAVEFAKRTSDAFALDLLTSYMDEVFRNVQQAVQITRGPHQVAIMTNIKSAKDAATAEREKLAKAGQSVVQLAATYNAYFNVTDKPTSPIETRAPAQAGDAAQPVISP